MKSRSEHSTEKRVFPVLHGKTLLGDEMRLPNDLDGELNLIFVAFHQRQQLSINRWIRQIGAAEDRHPGLALYEVPLMKRFPGFYRDWIDRGMKAGLPDPKTRRRTVTVYTDRDSFLDSAGLGGTSDIWVVVVDRTGTIFWSHVGEYSDDAAESLEWTLGNLT